MFGVNLSPLSKTIEKKNSNIDQKSGSTSEMTQNYENNKTEHYHSESCSNSVNSYKCHGSNSSHTTIMNGSSQYFGNKTAQDNEETLEDILRDIGLYNELYEDFKVYGLDFESLFYMKDKHIDQVMESRQMWLKIVFEKRIKDWQTRYTRGRNIAVSLEISQSTCENAEHCQLLSIKDMNGTSVNYHLPRDDSIQNLPERLMDVVKNSLDAVLREYNKPTTAHDVVISKDSEANTLNNGIVEHCDGSFIKIEIADAACESQSQASTQIESKNESDKSENLKNIRMIKPSNQIVDNHRLELSPLYSRKRKWGLETEVKEILLMYKAGCNILEAYRGFDAMTPEMRIELVHILVDHFVLNHEYLSTLECRKLAEEIIELFPTESLDTYFYQEFKNCTPKGKLWDRYQSRRQRHKKTLTTLLSTAPSCTYARTDRTEMELLCSELKFIDDENRLLRKWNKTFHFRRYQLQSQHFGSWKLYFDEYPFCKQPNYTQFIDADLDALYPNLKFDENLWDEFVNNFKLLYWNRITHPISRELFDDLLSIEDTSGKSDFFEIKIIKLLHAVLNTEPDVIERAQRQFTVEVPDLGDLKKVVIERKKFCLDNNIQCKPYVAVVGQNRHYEHFSVVIDSTGFSCDSYQESLILCFKLYLFFDLCYSNETFNTWIFIQRYFFNKHSAVKNDTVGAFILDLRSQRDIKFK